MDQAPAHLWIPQFQRPEHLFVCDLTEVDVHVQVAMTCLQGIVNRLKPRIYLVHDKANRCFPESGSADRAWLRYYSQGYGVTHEEVSPEELLRRFGAMTRGYVVWDPELGDTLNVACTMAGLQDVLPVTERLIPTMDQLDIGKADDLTGRWDDKIESYRWSVQELLPYCNDRLLGHVQVPVNPDSPIQRFGVAIRDILVACRAFTFSVGMTPPDASSRDPKSRPVWPGTNQEKDLVYEIYGSLRAPALIFGWITTALDEGVYVSTNSKFGHVTLCGMNNAGNFSVHAGFPRRRRKSRKASRRLPPLERKVYVCFALSDGDALWNINLRMHGEWDRPDRGRIPFGWTFQPILAEVAPGILDFFENTSTPNDCFVAGPSGVGYYKPSLMANLREYLRLSSRLMDQCGIDVVMGLIDEPVGPRTDIRIPQLFADSIPALLGVVEGYASTYDFQRAWHTQIIWVDGMPWMNNVCRIGFKWQEPMTTEGILETLRYLASHERTRPLFIPMHLPVTNKATYSMCVRAVEQLGREFVVVRPDDFMLLLRLAHETEMMR